MMRRQPVIASCWSFRLRYGAKRKVGCDDFGLAEYVIAHGLSRECGKYGTLGLTVGLGDARHEKARDGVLTCPIRPVYWLFDLDCRVCTRDRQLVFTPSLLPIPSTIIFDLTTIPRTRSSHPTPPCTPSQTRPL